LDEFLQAPVYEERHGMVLSVLSALARLGLDPWEQAAALAGMPREAAARELGSLMSALPEWSAPGHDGKLITTRLAALLPGSPARLFGGAKADEQPEPTSRAPNLLWIYAIVMLLLLSVQWLNARSHLDPVAPLPPVTAESSAQTLLPALPAK
jgi:hypothetical protein